MAPTLPMMTLWMARVVAGGSYGRSSAAIMANLEERVIIRRI
jgi:hypothetical protein